MKNPGNLIAALVGLCMVFALTSFFLPDRSGLALSYLTISLAVVVGILCVAGMVRLFFRGQSE
ncbi:MAG: hypothetical protein E7426_01825 [Ruminococcaceae bacterium]|jgi:hypothetical protein|nr:hypothetical protein [Oscillospiraceae bacterium]